MPQSASCQQEAQESQRCSSSPDPKAWEPGVLPWQEKMGAPHEAGSQCVLPLHLCSIQALIEWDYAHLFWWEKYSSLILRIQMLISSEIILTAPPRSSPANWVLLSPATLARKMNHHRSVVHNPFSISPTPRHWKEGRIKYIFSFFLTISCTSIKTDCVAATVKYYEATGTKRKTERWLDNCRQWFISTQSTSLTSDAGLV